MRIGICDWCGNPIKIHPRDEKKIHHFCSIECMSSFRSKTKNPDRYKDGIDYSSQSRNMHNINLKLNPSRMTPNVREKVRNARLNTGAGVTYAKFYGRHEHRVVAEHILGRPLKPGEIVHHKDGNKRNNAPENIEIYASQSEHARHHMKIKIAQKEFLITDEEVLDEV